MEVERLVLISLIVKIKIMSNKSNVCVSDGQRSVTYLNLGIYKIHPFLKTLYVYRNDEHALMISTLLEAIFLHGFQEHGVKVITYM